jgi:hypothetical protein
MKFIGRMLLFILVAGLSMGPAFIGCDDDSKSDKNLLTLALALLGVYTPDKIYIYSGGTHDAYLANRAAANSLCQSAASGITALSGKAYKKAFISFSISDQIKDIVDSAYQSLPVYGIKANGTETSLKDSWSNLWNGSGIDNRLMDATDITDVWWSGSENDGTFLTSSASCNGWTCNVNPCVPASLGYLGAYTSTSATWVNPGLTVGCNINTVYVLCVAY